MFLVSLTLQLLCSAKFNEHHCSLRQEKLHCSCANPSTTNGFKSHISIAEGHSKHYHNVGVLTVYQEMSSVTVKSKQQQQNKPRHKIS
jgi:hypothetical protein